MIPWKDVRWPRQVELQWIDLPKQAAAGESIMVSVENRRGPLPANLVLHVRESDHSTESPGHAPSHNPLYILCLLRRCPGNSGVMIKRCLGSVSTYCSLAG